MVLCPNNSNFKFHFQVSDIWLLMQEEGVTPTRAMKVIIRNACLNAGRADPFAAVNPAS